MSYKTYEKYIDSNIEWFKNVPEHWNLIKIKHMINYYTNGAWGIEKQKDNNDIICIRIADFDYPKRTIQDVDYTIRNISLNSRLLLEPGDLLIEKSGGGEKQPVGRVVIFDKDLKATFSNFICKIKIKDEYDSRFLCYMFNMLYSSRVNTKSIKQTTGIQNLDSYAYFDEIIAIPNILEQQQIVYYLDKKTAKIDATISKNEELIELLEEKRVALINQVVTKGLNPNVTMKDSGVEWIGEIPKHWDISRLKFLINKNAQYGANCEPEPDETKFDYRYVRITDIDDDASLKDNIVYLCKEDAKGFVLKEGDILFARSGATVGKTYLYDSSDGYCCFAGYLIRYVPNKLLLNPKYLLYFSFSKSYTEWIKIVSTQATIQNVSADKYDNLIISLPCVDEQNKIVSFLDDKITNINKSISKIQENITLLEEYKASLIHHVVTGKIDIRGEKI